MRTINLFTSNLEGKALVSEKAATRKATALALADFAKSIEAEFTKVIKAEDRRARNVANAAKGKYKTALQVITECFPFQTKDGVLCCKRLNEDGTAKVWAAKKLTAAAARSIVRESLNNFTKYVGKPVVTIVTIGEPVESSK